MLEILEDFQAFSLVREKGVNFNGTSGMQVREDLVHPSQGLCVDEITCRLRGINTLCILNRAKLLLSLNL